MDNLYLLSLIPILLTEYGFRSSNAALHQMKHKYGWGRTSIRFLFWFLIASLTVSKYDTDLVMPVFSLFVIGEICCLYLRISIRRDLRSGLRYGSIKTHMIPFVFPGILIPAVYMLLTLYLRRMGMNIDLGKVLVAELLNPFVMLQTKQLLVSVVFISEWTWASLVTRSLECSVQLIKKDEILDPGSARREIFGILERLVTLMLVTLGGHVGAGIVIAIKSTTRLPKLINRQDADQFVVETLSSVGLSTLGGLLIMNL